MNTRPLVKTKRKNFRFTIELAAKLKSRTVKSGKTETQEIEDLIDGTRLFPREVEAFIDEETERTGKPRWRIIEDAVLLMAHTRENNGHGMRTVQTAQGSLKAGKPSPALRKKALDALHRSKAKN